MNTLDRYIARQFFVNIVSLLVLICSFVVTIDVALNLNRYSSVLNKTPGADALSLIGRFVRMGELIGDLWWPRLIQLFVFLLGMILVGAMGFTVTQLVRHRELVAMMAGGVSLRRVARPILVVAGLMTVVQALNQELVIPRIAPLLTRDHGDAGKRNLKDFEVPLTDDGQGRVFYAKKFDPTRETLVEATVFERDASTLTRRTLSAPLARWDATQAGWILENATIFDNEEASVPDGVRRSPPGAAQPVESSPQASPVLVKTSLDPKALTLRRYANFSHSLSWRELSSILSTPNLEERLHDKLVRVKYGRVSTIIANFLTLLIVLPFFLMREPKNMVVQSLKCAPVGIVSLLLSVLLASATIPGLPPALGVFIPVILLTPIAVASITSMRT